MYEDAIIQTSQKFTFKTIYLPPNCLWRVWVQHEAVKGVNYSWLWEHHLVHIVHDLPKDVVSFQVTLFQWEKENTW